MSHRKIKLDDLKQIDIKDLQKWIEIVHEVEDIREATAKDVNIANEYQEYANAIETVLGDETAADRIKILKMLLEEARMQQKLKEPKSIDENELVDNWQTAPYPYKRNMDTKRYEKQLYRLQVELTKLQDWVKNTGKKVVIIFEGRDAAGKGGTISRFTEHLNPRIARIVALPKPTETEAGQWFFQRYVAQLPTRGEIRLFDRSWYNRAGVDRVMGFCTEKEYDQFMHQCPHFEEDIMGADTILIKFWFSVTQKEQHRRFKARRIDPLRRWKLSPMDLASLTKWDEYTAASEAMFAGTDKDRSPWIVIKSDDKKRARLNAIRYVLSLIDYEGKNEDAIGELDPKIISRATKKTDIRDVVAKLKKVKKA